MTIKEQAFSWLLIVFIAGLMIVSSIFFNNWQVEKSQICPAYKTIPCDCEEVLLLDCPEDSYEPQVITQYTCPSEDINKMGLQEILIETQQQVIEKQQDSIHKLRNIITDLQ